jgi:hypothetical protein
VRVFRQFLYGVLGSSARRIDVRGSRPCTLRAILPRKAPHPCSGCYADYMIRVLVTVEPRMYREAIALGLQRLRPDLEVMLVPENVLDGQVEAFRPHVLVRNNSDGAIPEWLLGDVMCRVEVLYTDSMDTRISMDGRSYTIEDASLEDLLSLLDEAEKLVSD